MLTPRRTMTRAFRTRMLKQAAAIFVGLAAVLLILAGTLGEKAFLFAALVLAPSAAVVFNVMQRRAYAAERRNGNREGR